jgi:hypothetical protein
MSSFKIDINEVAAHTLFQNINPHQNPWFTWCMLMLAEQEGLVISIKADKGANPLYTTKGCSFLKHIIKIHQNTSGGDCTFCVWMLAFNHEVFTCGGIACSIGAARPS